MIDDIIYTLFKTKTLFILTQSYGLESADSCTQYGWVQVLDNKPVHVSIRAEYSKGSKLLKFYFERSSIDEKSITNFFDIVLSLPSGW